MKSFDGNMNEGRGDRRGIKPNYFLPKPVKAGDEIDVTIEAVASKGDGIAKKDGFVIFVKGAKQGENVHVRISDVKVRYAIGELQGPAQSAPSQAAESSEESAEEPSEEEASEESQEETEESEEQE